jgi:hypothetical protein
VLNCLVFGCSPIAIVIVLFVSKRFVSFTLFFWARSHGSLFHFSDQFALAVWLVTERLSNPFFELPTALSDPFLLDVLDADTAGAVDEAALATDCASLLVDGRTDSAVDACYQAVWRRRRKPSLLSPLRRPLRDACGHNTPAAANVATADASNDHSENSSHHSEDSWRAS